jgi:hypothetical protein
MVALRLLCPLLSFSHVAGGIDHAALVVVVADRPLRLGIVRLL